MLPSGKTIRPVVLTMAKISAGFTFGPNHLSTVLRTIKSVSIVFLSLGLQNQVNNCEFIGLSSCAVLPNKQNFKCKVKFCAI